MAPRWSRCPSSSSAAIRPRISCSGAPSSMPSGSSSPASLARPRALGCACALGLVVARGSSVYNVAALVHAGQIWGFVPKEKLPLYNVFYEARTLARGAPGLYDTLAGVPFGDLVFDLDFGTVALEVCEDGWSPDGPMRRRSYAGAEVVLNLSASPVSARRRRDAPRDDRDARGRLPGDRRVRERRRSQRRTRVRRRRVRRAERTPVARVVALSRRRRGGDSRSGSHPATAHGEHDLARGPGGLLRRWRRR